MARTYDDTMFIDTFEHEFTWLSGFLRNVRRFPLRPAVLDPDVGKMWTYEALNREANALAQTLQKEGVSRGNVVMTLLKNSPEAAFCYCGVRKIGAVLLTANFNLSERELSLLISHNSPVAIIASTSCAFLVSRVLSSLETPPKILVAAKEKNDENIPNEFVSYEEFVRNASFDEPKIDFRPHIYDEVLRLCTSGTTALPKCVPINDINEVLSAHDVIMHYPLYPCDVTMNMTPWFHRGGVHSGGLCPSFYAGATVVVMRTFRPQTTLDWVSRYKINFLMGSPANLEMLSRSQEKKNRDLSTLRGIVTMGAPLSKSNCIRFMQTLTPRIFNGYGTTETFWNSFLRPFDLPVGAGTVGNVCFDDDVRVVSLKDGATFEDTVKADGKTEGEIIIRSAGKSTFTYIGNEQAAKEKFRAGWMFTGDTGTWDVSGVVTVRGRKDDMMVVSGENIYPEQIEQAIKENKRVLDALVTSVPDSLRGEVVVAYVVPSDDSLSIRELAEFCSQSSVLPSYKKPRYFSLVSSLPLTATGKKKRNEMKIRAKDDFLHGRLKKV